jgi:protein TonB
VDVAARPEPTPWKIVPEQSHDLKDAEKVTGEPDQNVAAIFAGGEIALNYTNDESTLEDKTLNVYGTRGDRTPYTMFARNSVTDQWLRVDANRTGFPRGFVSHAIGPRRQAHQIKIRNDGRTTLFIDAIVVMKGPGPILPETNSRAREPSDAAARSPSGPSVRPAISPPTANQREPAALPAPITAVPVSVVPASASASVTVGPPSSGLAELDDARGTSSPPGASIDRPVPPAPSTTPLPPEARQTSSPGETNGVRGPGRVEPPQKLRGPAPDYPPIAEAANVEGTVVIEAVVDSNGRVTSARIRDSIPLLDKAALDAIRQWEFKPALLNGRPVPFAMTLSVRFTLP